MSQSARAQSSGSMPASHAGTPGAPGGAVSALLTDPLGSRSASGTATVTGNAVRIAWSGDLPGSRRVWSVRRGSCTREQGIVGATSSYAPIAVDASGAGSAVATLDAPLDASTPSHVVVHAGGATDVALACGALWNGTTMPQGADHSAHGAPSATPPSVSTGSVDHSAMDHSTMAHSMMSTPGTSMPKTGMSNMSMPMMGDNASKTLMAIHMRMMEDPVIRERVRTDPVLQRMMEQLSMNDSSSMDMTMPGMTSTPAASARGAAKTPAAKSASKPAARTPAKAAAKPTPKPAAKPAPTSMPGMDHSKMPGMNQSKPPVTRKPPA